MSGQIIIAGGGDSKQSLLIDKYFHALISARTSSRVLYLPLALPDVRYKQACQWFEEQYGYIEDVTVVKNLQDAGRALKEQYDAIYLGGGNTGKLLVSLRALELDSFISEQLRNDTIVYGGSAGAIVLGKTIKTAPVDELTSTDSDGLNLLGGYSVVPHFSGEFSEAERIIARSCNTSLIGIGESSGVVFQDSRIIKVFNKSGLKELTQTSP